MKVKEFFGKALETLLSHDLFRIVVLVMVVVRTSAFLSPVIGPFVKFTIVWAVLILIRDLFTQRLFLVNRYRLILYLFLISYGITALLNRDENFARNIAMLGYIMVNMLVLYAYEPKRSVGQVKKELLRFSHVFLITTFICQFISLVTFVLNINFAYMVGEDVYYYGIYDGRLWGVLSNPNAASFCAVISFMLTTLCLLIQKGNIPRRWQIFYWVSGITELLVFFLCNSRTSLIVTCAFIILFFLLMTIPALYQLREDKKAWKIKLRNLIISCILAPLALLGAHEYAIDLLPNLVIQNTAISEQVTESLESYTNSSAAVTAIENSDVLERENFGSAFGGRYYLWQAGAEIVKSSPLFGVGNDNVPTFAYRYAARYYTAFATNVYLPGVAGGLHNLFVQIAAASGLVGLALFCLLAVMVLVRSVRYYIWMVKQNQLNRVAVTCFCIVAVILMRTMTDTGIVYGLYYLGVVFWTILSGLMYFMDHDYTEGRKPVGAWIEERLFHPHQQKAAPWTQAPSKTGGMKKLSLFKAGSQS